MTDTRLIERWLPIAALGEESVRERRSMTALPPTYYLHVWWARRPLVASRAAILAALLPADADREMFMRVLGIHGDPVASRKRIDRAKRTGTRFEGEAYSYPRAFIYNPSEDERAWVEAQAAELGLTAPAVLDPTAGGGSIPFENARMGFATYANDLNPVAVLIQRATYLWPIEFGTSVRNEFDRLANRYLSLREERLEQFFPKEPDPNAIPTNYLWARTITCPYCGGLVPLSPNWRLAPDGTGVRLIPHPLTPSPSPLGRGEQRRCSFEIVNKLKDQSSGTVAGGDGTCPFPDCQRVIDGEVIKRQAQEGRMGEQLFTVVYKRKIVSKTKTGKEKIKWERGYRAPRPEDDVSERIAEKLAEKLPEWEALDIVPTERFPETTNDDRPIQYGMPLWRDLFSPRQLLGHGTAVEIYRELLDEEQAAGRLDEKATAAFGYLALSLDKMLNYNSRMSVWMPTREVVANTFNRHDFAFCWSHAEMAPLIVGLGYDWAIEQTGKCIAELVELARPDLTGSSGSQTTLDFHDYTPPPITLTCKPGDSLDHIEDASIDAVVMDPPYCLAPGTLIQTQKGYKPIEDIEVGDKVLTHAGRFAKVTKTYRHAYHGPMQRLTVAHSNQPLLITPEHPIYGIDTQACGYQKAYCRADCAYLEQQGGCRHQAFSNYRLEWIEARSVKANALIFFPQLAQDEALPPKLSATDWLPAGKYVEQEGVLHYQKASPNSLLARAQLPRHYQFPAHIEVTPSLCRLLGYFAAEGYANVRPDGGTLYFTFHQDEAVLHEDVQSLIRECFGVEGAKPHSGGEHNRSVRLQFYSKPLAELFRAWCYQEGLKCLPEWAMSLPDNCIAEIVKGYWWGDGCRRNAEYSAGTNSPYLAGQIRLLLQRLGVVARLHIDSQRKNRVSVVNGQDIICRGDYYMLIVAGESIAILSQHVGDPKKEKMRGYFKKQHWHKWAGGYVAPIRKVETFDYNGEVYNLETEDHSYVTSSGCVHNCDNVMYAELSDFFYVWLKRTAGYVYPELFRRQLTDKEHEAVANPAKFKGEKGAKALATRDYQERMAMIFAECRRTLKANGILVLMFTHKATGAWDALIKGLMEAGFTITASWPINTEAEGSLHIKDKAAANSTIFLVCRPRIQQRQGGDTVYWEDVEPLVAQAVRARVKDFQAAGIGGVDLYLASFGPALEKFSEFWPLQRGTPRPLPEARKRRRQAEIFEEAWDPYAVTPEDALDAARREVKRWRLEQLTHLKANAELDPATSWFVLAWDAFRAPVFAYDEALRLARAVGVDLDGDIVGRLAEKKGSDIRLWDSAGRAAKGTLGPADGSRGLIDTIHHAANQGRTRTLANARDLIEHVGLNQDPRFFAALEAVLEVLPVSAAFTGIELDGDVAAAGSDFEVLENLRKLAFTEHVDAPQQLEIWRNEP